VRRQLIQTGACGGMGAWRWVVARASEFGEVSLAVILSVVAGLMFATACGAPDEVMRGQAQLTGGNTGGSSGGALSSSSSSGGTTTVAGSTASSTLAGGAVGPGGAGGSSSVGGNSTLGGATTAGGTTGGGGISNTGGKGSGGAGTGGKGSGGAATGGKNTGGAATGGVATGGAGGGTSPFGGSTGGVVTGGNTGGVSGGGVGSGGTTTASSGGTGGSSGGASGSGGATSTSAPATGALQVWVGQKATGSTGKIALTLRIDNKTSSSVDMAAVTLRYWYQDEGLGTALVFANDYVKIGYSIAATATGKVVAAPPPVAGADHYIELSFTGTAAPQGDKSSNDQFNASRDRTHRELHGRGRRNQRLQLRRRSSESLREEDHPPRQERKCPLGNPARVARIRLALLTGGADASVGGRDSGG
jgi:hypothetical protein